MFPCSPIRRLIFVAPLLSFGFLVGNSPEASGQSLLEQLGRQVEQEVRRNLQRNQEPPSRGGSPGDSERPGVQSAIPEESGPENNRRGTFNPGDFFRPRNPPRTSPPRTSPPRTYPPGNTPPPNGARPLPYYPDGQPAPPPRRVSPPPVTDFNYQELKVRSPKSMTRNVIYWLESGGSRFDFVMQPGHAQTLTESRVWIIHFRQLGRVMTYRLRGGKLYEFDVDSQGRLQLYMVGDYNETNNPPEPPRRSPNRNR